jgi:hypothetical protein
MSQTTVQLHFGHSLNVLTQLHLKYVQRNLQIVAFFVVALSVQKPMGDTASLMVRDEVDDLAYMKLLIPALTRGLMHRILQIR